MSLRASALGERAGGVDRPVGECVRNAVPMYAVPVSAEAMRAVPVRAFAMRAPVTRLAGWTPVAARTPVAALTASR